MLALALAAFASLAPHQAMPTAAAQPTTRASVDFRVEGMHCGACANRLQDVLTRVQGVIDAEVSFDETRAVVTYDPRRLTTARLVQVIEEAGFRARVQGH